LDITIKGTTVGTVAFSEYSCPGYAVYWRNLPGYRLYHFGNLIPFPGGVIQYSEWAIPYISPGDLFYSVGSFKLPKTIVLAMNKRICMNYEITI
tara:strand:- start:25 stop:306 length:282 start_codon:yes stop_codon:yes gene_type:complete